MSEYIVELDLDSVVAGIKYGPIGRCRDCVFLDEYGCTQFDFYTSKNMPNGFCAWGERKDNVL